MSAPSVVDIAAFTRASLNRRSVATGLRPLVEALGVQMPPRESPDRGSRSGLRHYTKEEYVNALLAHRDRIVQENGGVNNIATSAAADAGFSVNDIVQFTAPGSRSPVLATVTAIGNLGSQPVCSLSVPGTGTVPDVPLSRLRPAARPERDSSDSDDEPADQGAAASIGLGATRPRMVEVEQVVQQPAPSTAQTSPATSQTGPQVPLQLLNTLGLGANGSPGTHTMAGASAVQPASVRVGHRTLAHRYGLFDNVRAANCSTRQELHLGRHQ